MKKINRSFAEGCCIARYIFCCLCNSGHNDEIYHGKSGMVYFADTLDVDMQLLYRY